MAVETIPGDLPLASQEVSLVESLGSTHEWLNRKACVKGNLMFLNIEPGIPTHYGTAGQVLGATVVTLGQDATAVRDAILADYPTATHYQMEQRSYVLGGVGLVHERVALVYITPTLAPNYRPDIKVWYNSTSGYSTSSTNPVVSINSYQPAFNQTESHYLIYTSASTAVNGLRDIICNIFYVEPVNGFATATLKYRDTIVEDAVTRERMSVVRAPSLDPTQPYSTFKGIRYDTLPDVDGWAFSQGDTTIRYTEHGWKLS